MLELGITHAEAALATVGSILILERADDLVRLLGERKGALALIQSGRHGRGDLDAVLLEPGACIYWRSLLL